MLKKISFIALILIISVISISIPYSKATCACIPEVVIEFDDVNEFTIERNHIVKTYSKKQIKNTLEEIELNGYPFFPNRYEEADMSIYNRLRVGSTLEKVTIRQDDENIEIVIYKNGLAKTNKGEWFKSNDLSKFISLLEKSA